MHNPFPGMNPYLEGRWQDVHHSLCTYARDALQPQVRPTLRARVEERTIVELPDRPDRQVYPDVKIVESRGGTALLAAPTDVAEPLTILYGSDPRTEGYVTILDPANGNAIVTVIEFLSLSNKRPGNPRDQYQLKRDELHGANVNLVEIDLLRAGPWAFAIPQAGVPRSHRSSYRVCTHRGSAGLAYQLYHLPIEQRLPRLAIPLRPGDADVVLDLQPLIDQAYANGAYDDEFDYAADADPPLTGDAAAWADAMLRAAGRRA